MDTVFTKSYEAPSVNVREILRYMGCPNGDPKCLALIDECLSEIAPQLIYKVCHRQFTIQAGDSFLDLTFIKTDSNNLRKNLQDCESIVLFAATVGIGADRLISKYGRISPAKALCFQAIGSERIESLANAFNREINEKVAAAGLFTRPRFSPGYGDLPLAVQRDVFRVLDCSRKIGLSLNDSLLMSPSKSVTALIGISSKERTCAEQSSCAGCNKQNCSFRS